jgi:L-glyceraldehyde 3-phosphate reductase
MTYTADPARYDRMPYRRVGASGLKLPALSLGLWQNFGDDRPLDAQRAIVRRAFDLGITHFDLANNYGPPYGSAEANFGRLLATDLAPYRDELVVSTKAGWDMWPGPYGVGGSRKYVIASLDASLRRLGLDSVDLFYHPRPAPETPGADPAGALASIVELGKALYVGVSSYSADDTRRMRELLAERGVPLTIHQPSYSMLNRWIETEGLVDAAGDHGFGIIGFTALAQGLLSGKYHDGVPEGSRASIGDSLDTAIITDELVERLRALTAIAERRGQTLPQLALAWALRDERVTSLVLGVSRVEQLEQNVAALDRLDFSDEELAEIDALAGTTEGVDLWAEARRGGPLPVLRP